MTGLESLYVGGLCALWLKTIAWKKEKMDEGCRNNTRTSSLFLCTAPPDASGKRKRGKESKKWNEQQSYDKMCFN